MLNFRIRYIANKFAAKKILKFFNRIDPKQPLGTEISRAASCPKQLFGIDKQLLKIFGQKNPTRYPRPREISGTDVIPTEAAGTAMGNSAGSIFLVGKTGS